MVSVSLTQGRRPHMEDTYIVDEIKKKNGKSLKVWCVFDGHGGGAVSKMCKNDFINVFKKYHLRSPEIDVCLKKTYQELDHKSTDIGFTCGTTAVTLLKRNGELWIANCGDSEAMVGFKNGSYKKITECHKVEDEKKRLQSLGAEITYDDRCARISRMLNLGRSIGDHYLKKYVISTPYVRCLRHSKTNPKNDIQYVLIASDGLWDVFDETTLNHEIRDLIKDYEKQGKETKEIPDLISYEITRRALLRGSMDNITVILAFLFN